MSFRAQTPQRKAEIVVITPGYTSPHGGAAQVVGELITTISRRAPFHFTWVAQEEPAADGKKSSNQNQALQGLLPQTLLPMRGGNFARNTFIPWRAGDRPSLKAMRQAIAAADLVWIHDTLYPGARLAYRLARELGRPVLATRHESPIFYAAQDGNLLRRLWIRLKDRLSTIPLLRQARQVTFTSNVAARFYHRRVSFRTPAKVIPNGVESHIFHPPTADDYKTMRTRFALRDDQPVMLFVGRFEETSGMSVLHHMAKLLPNWRFWLAGDGRIRPENWYLPNVQVFKGRTGEALAEIYQAADLLILPGYDMESPHVMQQALACQLPVMCGSAAVAAHAGGARCLVVKSDLASPETTARHWVQKLKAGKDVWPAAPEGETPFDSSWDWLQVAAHYTEIIQTLCKAQPKSSPVAAPRSDSGNKIAAKTAR